jgi:glutathione S-transferase
MTTLYDNGFSPFARKVRLVLDHKRIAYDTVDGLRHKNREALSAVNGRVEVPALVHEGVVVVNSPDIVAFLERTFPERPVYPPGAEAWVRARAWERCADTVLDPILIDISYWTWADRDDRMPDGMLTAARADLAHVYRALERDLSGGDFVCGALSIADFALFPHLAAVRALDVPFDKDAFPRLYAWLTRMRGLDVCAADLERTKGYLATAATLDIERKKLFWRGDRIEWLLARGFHRWFAGEIEAGRALWPGLGIPGPAGA